MSILIDNASPRPRPGHHRARGRLPHRRACSPPGTNVVAGVTPGHGGETVEGVPVFDSVHEAVAHIRADVAVIFVPAPRARDALFEAADAGIKLVVCITEGIPVRDMAEVMAHLPRRGARLIGPNCPGLITPGALQRRHHAVGDLHARRRRRGLALGHAHLRGRARAHAGRHRPVHRRRHGRRRRPRHRLHRVPGAVRGRPRDRGRRAHRRDRRRRRGARGAVHPRAT